MVRGIVDNFKCSSFFYFLRLYVCRFSFSCLTLPVRFWKNVYEALSLRHFKTVHDHPFIEKMSPLSVFDFVLLNCTCSLSAAHSDLIAYSRSPLLFICCEGARASLTWTLHFYFHIKGGLQFQQRIIKWPAQR